MLWSILSALALVLPVFSAADEAQSPRLLGAHYLGDLPTLVADERGFFRDVAADLRIEYTSSGRTNLARLRAGEADFIVTALTPLVIDALQDSSPGGPDDPVILGNLVHSHRLNQVVTLSGTGVSGPADLEGRRVGLMKGTNAEFAWARFAYVHGVDTDKVEVLDEPIDKLPAALSQGRVDAAVLWEPWTSRTASASRNKMRVLPDGSAYGAHWVVVARRDFVQAHPALTRALLQGYSRSIDWIESHRDQALQLYVRRMDVSAAHIERSWAVLDYDLALGWTVLNALRLQLQWARDAGYTDASTAEPGVLQLVEPRPLRRLDAARVSIPRAPDRRGATP